MATRFSRQIKGLKWARLCDRPRGLPIGRPRGAKAAGLRYERVLAKALPDWTHGQWFEFEDQNGPGHCQVDLFKRVEIPGCDKTIAIIEAKYTWTLAGHLQISHLYKPVLEMAFNAKAFGFVACKVLTRESHGKTLPFGDLQEAMYHSYTDRAVALHWIGSGPVPLGPSSAPRVRAPIDHPAPMCPNDLDEFLSRSI